MAYIIRLSAAYDSNLVPPYGNPFLTKITEDFSDPSAWGLSKYAIHFETKDDAIEISRKIMQQLLDKGYHSFGAYVCSME